MQVLSLDTGEVLFSLEAHAPLAPASNTKLVTSAAALDVLGVDYQFVTEIAARGRVDAGRLEGDLVVIGGGDPSFRDDFEAGDGWRPLRDLAAQVAAAGIREVSGALVLDDRLFDREFTAVTWPADQRNRDYCAPVAALSLRGNCLPVEVAPPRSAGALASARTLPELPIFRIESEIVGTGVKGQNEVALSMPDASGRVLAKGRTWILNPVQTYLVPVPDPPLYFGAALHECLAGAGVRVSGGVRAIAEQEPRGDVRPVARCATPLARVITTMNKESDNNLAEHLFKLAASKRSGTGTFATGSVAVREFLRSIGVPESEQRFVDGSGLSRENRITPAALTTLLSRCYHSAATRDLFVASLPVAGIDGSLKNRLVEEPFRGHVRAKTGFINRVSALSGYVRTLSGGSLAFSILMNDFQASNAAMKEIQDNICRILVRHEAERVVSGG